MSFSGKVVLVTGASSGIGAATAVHFSKEGAKVTIVARNAAKLNKVRQQCIAFGTPPLIIIADVSNEEDVKKIIKQTIEHFGKLDILVNNAGISRYASVSDPNILEVYDEVMNTNLRSIVQLTNLAAPHLANSKGCIVNVSSVAAHYVLGLRGMASYSVSKAAVDHFTRCAAFDLAGSGIRVNCVNPGPVKTDIIENSGFAPPGASDQMWEAMRKQSLLDRVSDPEEIAEMIAYLSSDKARGITGSVYVVDNGSTLYRPAFE